MLLVLVKAFQAASKHLYAGLAETETTIPDFWIFEALFEQRAFAGVCDRPKSVSDPGSSPAVDRPSKALVSWVRVRGSARPRRVAHPKGKIDRAGLSKHAEIKGLCRCEPW